jgi:pyridoxal phosphate enzyme (YggS family)
LHKAEPIADALQALHSRIARAEQAAGRPAHSVQLLAVSKTFGVDAVRAAIAAGQRAFGENYVQEGVEKILALGEQTPSLSWHFIGPLQSNKTRLVAQHFDWVHGVASERIALRLAEQRPPEREPLQVCIQVNISGEASKSGCEPEEATELVCQLATRAGLEHALCLRGIMVIAQASEESAIVRAQFAQTRALFETIRARLEAIKAPSCQSWDTLSMGMSNDLEDAIAEGATLVRVGSAIFGARSPLPTPPVLSSPA